MNTKKLKETSLGGINQNPVFILVLGMCSVLAVTGTLKDALGMGVAVTAVLILSNTVISLLRKIIPDKVRIPAYIVIIATFVTIVKMVMRAYIEDLYDTLGDFISLIVVNCIVFARAEGFAKNNNPAYAALDGLSMGIGYTLAVMLMAFVKELLGLGTLFGAQIFADDFSIPFFQSPAGSLMTLALLIAAYVTIVSAIKNRKSKSKKEAAPAVEAAATEVAE